ncbi:hypothetical protein, partial [uncultured Acidaminococcus sp.]|uniref:hypothetical protein n=1 Tax=uncultured Acidaminococcus sp. TaxID=352152 RepID=UPI00258A7618
PKVLDWKRSGRIGSCRLRKFRICWMRNFFCVSGGWIPDAGASAFEFAALWAAGTGLPGLSPYIVGVIDFNGETGKNMVQ